jgi:hypothetical protein
MWLLVPIEFGLLVALLIADPGRIDRSSRLLRRLEIALTLFIAIMAAVAVVWLVVELVDGAPHLQRASTLLRVGGLVWATTNLTFAVLYWELDGGGAAERLHHMRAQPDFAFPEQINPSLAPP